MPVGAPSVDKSFITDVVEMLKESDSNQKYKVYAVVAPSISGQFSYAKLGQVITGDQKAGLPQRWWRPRWAQTWLLTPKAAELAEKGLFDQLLLSGLCRLYPQKIPCSMVEHISHNLSPMASHWPVYQRALIPTAKIVFHWTVYGQKDGISKRKRFVRILTSVVDL